MCLAVMWNLNKSYKHRANVKYPAIVQFGGEVVDTIDEYNAPNLITPDHKLDHKSNFAADDYMGQDDNIQIYVPSVLSHGNYVLGWWRFRWWCITRISYSNGSWRIGIVDEENEVSAQPRSETTINQKVLIAMKNLEASFNPKNGYRSKKWEWIVSYVCQNQA